jgi:hypothetical protein
VPEKAGQVLLLEQKSDPLADASSKSAALSRPMVLDGLPEERCADWKMSVNFSRRPLPDTFGKLQRELRQRRT